MSDLISRNAVLDAITESINQFGGRYTAEQLNMWGLSTQMVQELPSAEVKTQMSSADCISRQAVLKGICLSCTGQSDVIKAEAALVRYVKKMPSAQPVITCDGCRFVSTYDTDFPCCSCVRREKDYYEPER